MIKEKSENKFNQTSAIFSGIALASDVLDHPVLLSAYVQSFGATSQDAQYNALYDLDNDDDIDGRDIFALLDDHLPPAGNLFGECSIPSDAMEADTASPEHVIGDGTAASCTSQAVVDAIAGGGIISFNCGPDPVTITLAKTAKIFNNTGPDIVIDGGAIYNDGNFMTLSLCGTRIEYNEANQHGAAIFFVSNDYTGIIRIDDSVIRDNIGGTWYPKYPGISAHAVTPIWVDDDSIIE